MTGMSEEQILWELPLCRGMAYMHAALLFHGNDTQWPGDDDADDMIKQVRERIKRKPWRH